MHSLLLAPLPGFIGRGFIAVWLWPWREWRCEWCPRLHRPGLQCGTEEFSMHSLLLAPLPGLIAGAPLRSGSGHGANGM